jgi:nucleoside-diphosphate-sugar epimerase
LIAFWSRRRIIMVGTVLVLGATGGIGGAVARAFLKRGWRVVAMTRRPGAARSRPTLAGVEWREGDALNRGDVVAAAAGAAIIFHGAHPAGYAHWQDWGMAMLANSIAAAKASGARLILPGNIYNFGPDAGEFVAETAPQHPLTEKGRIRVRMETILAAAARDGVRSLVIRANDFIGADSPSSWFGVMVKAGKPIRGITYPGRRDVGHGFAYLPDLAETVARLAEIDDRLAPFEVVHFGGHWFKSGEDFVAAMRQASGKPDLKAKRFPWPLMALLSPFWPVARGVWEMRHLWREPLRLDNRKLVSLVGPEPHTPTDEALRETLAGVGCLAGSAAGKATPLVAA